MIAGGRPRPGLCPAFSAALCLSLCGGAILVASCAGPPPASAPVANAPLSAGAPGVLAFTEDEKRAILTLSPLPPPPPDPTNAVTDDPAAARLGQYLFYDTRLSADGTVSCASCHRPERNWTDGQPVPTAFGPGLRHVPTLWNVAYNRWFFWDGRADSLWAQALEPIENPKEHAATRAGCVRALREDPALLAAYQRVFGPLPADDAQTDRVFTNIGKAIAAFERKLVSTGAPFDTFVAGLKAADPARMRAIPIEAQRGLKLFIGPANCRSCHHGPTFTDGEFHDTRITLRFPAPAADPGRLAGVTKLLTSQFNAMGPFNDSAESRRSLPTAYLVNSIEYRGQFKTPSLRNVAMTAPYMHGGQMTTLEEVIAFYSSPPPLPPPPPPKPSPPTGSPSGPPAFAGGHTHRAATGPEKVLLPLNLSDQDVQDLIAFLKTLTDTRIDQTLLSKPESP